jgi:hypothetical protein
MKSINSEFKILLLNIIGFLLILILFDVTIGFFAKKIFFSQKTGKYARLTNSIYRDRSDILIMGNSHANRHYIPEILEKKLNMTCHNAGVQGQHLIFHTALLNMVLKRHKPKIIILNIDEPWMYHSTEAYDKLADLHPYYWDFRTEIDPILSLNSKFTTLKLLSSAYQTNSTLVHAVNYHFQPQEDFKGYRPFYNEMQKIDLSKESIIRKGTKHTQKIDSTFIIILEEFIDNAKINNINLFFVISPHYSLPNNSNVNISLEVLKHKASKYDIPLIDLSCDSSFIEKYYLFNDPSHLNNNGAIIFSKIVANKLSKNIESINTTR